MTQKKKAGLAEAEPEEIEPVEPEPPLDYDAKAEFERLAEDWPEYPLEQLTEVAELGPEAVKGWETAAKYKSVSIGKSGFSERDNPIVALRNKSDDPLFIKSRRYESDHMETIYMDGNEVQVNHVKGAVVRGDILAQHGLTQLKINPNTFHTCPVSLARAIRDKANMGDNLQIESYDPRKHDVPTKSTLFLTDDPSMSRARQQAMDAAAEDEARMKGAKAGYVSADKMRRLGGDVPTGDFNDKNNPMGRQRVK